MIFTLKLQLKFLLNNEKGKRREESDDSYLQIRHKTGAREEKGKARADCIPETSLGPFLGIVGGGGAPHITQQRWRTHAHVMCRMENALSTCHPRVRQLR